MFPSARIYKTQNGEEALKWAASPSIHFDIIIVEERLFSPNTSFAVATPQHSSLNGATGKRFLHLHKTLSENKHASQQVSSLQDLQKSDSLPLSSSEPPSECDPTTSGSNLLKAIAGLEKIQPTVAKTRKVETSAMVMPVAVPRKPLLIGVSVRPDRDAMAFRKAGADLVWGKPIPRVGESLRNQLLKALVDKRRRQSIPTPENRAKH